MAPATSAARRRRALCGNAGNGALLLHVDGCVRALGTIEDNGCAACVARLGGRVQLMEMLWMWLGTAARRKDTSNFLWIVLVTSVSFSDHSNACSVGRVSVSRDVLSVTTTLWFLPRFTVTRPCHNVGHFTF